MKIRKNRFGGGGVGSRGIGWGVRVDENDKLKNSKKNSGRGGGGGGGSGRVGGGGVKVDERRIESFAKIQKKYSFFLEGEGVGRGGGGRFVKGSGRM